MKKNGKYCSKKRTGMKPLAILLALTLLLGCAVGGTLAWLTANSTPVTNTFTESDIDITLDETGTENNAKNFDMVPGWKIDKDPYVTVVGGSEDCWLFVEVTESTNPVLADYIKYAVDQDTSTTTTKKTIGSEEVDVIHGGWTKGDGTKVPTYVYYRQVTDITADKVFAILGSGEYTVDGSTYSWGDDQVLVLPDVDKTDMNALENSNKPSLSFKAYAVQLWKSNNPGTGATDQQIEDAQFSAEEAWMKTPGYVPPTPSTP